jgi:hypothetical protein
LKKPNTIVTQRIGSLDLNSVSWISQKPTLGRKSWVEGIALYEHYEYFIVEGSLERLESSYGIFVKQTAQPTVW